MRKGRVIMASMAEDWNKTFWNTRRNNPVDLSLVLCGLDVDGEDHVDGEDDLLDVIPMFGSMEDRCV